MKYRKSTLIVFFIFILGFLVMMYPSLSNYWNSLNQTQAIMEYEDALSYLSEEDFEMKFKKADEYNRKLMELSSPLIDYKKIEGSSNILNIYNNSVIGYIEIEKIKLKLPIYYGTSKEVLNMAVGLLEGSSFPAGSKSSHTVLSAHRGLPSAELFTHIDLLKKGDYFSITILNKKFIYEVDQIMSIEPTDTEPLSIVKGKDYCSLITCTPYGINTHRLVIRGMRNDEAKHNSMKYGQDNIFSIDLVIILVICGLLLSTILVLVFLFKRKNE